MAKMHFERDDSMTRAVWIIRDRVRASNEFRYARDLVIEKAVRRVFEYDRDASVPTLRRLGGFSKVVEHALSDLPALYNENKGSKMFPYSVSDELRASVPDLRDAVQSVIATKLANRTR